MPLPKLFMRHFIQICALTFLIASCGESDTKQNELKNKDSQPALKEQELPAKTDSVNNTQPGEVQKQDQNKKVMTMTFEEYSEGDYPHVIFKETATGKTYDFRHISDNKLGDVPILLDDDKAGFGLKANPKYLGKSFVVEAVLKTVMDSDLDGTAIKVEDWVINDIRLNQN
jgi:hypothetical protein